MKSGCIEWQKLRWGGYSVGFKWKGWKRFSFNTLQTVWWFTPTWWATALVLDLGLLVTMFKMISSWLGLHRTLHRRASCLVRWNKPVSLSWWCNCWKILWSGKCLWYIPSSALPLLFARLYMYCMFSAYVKSPIVHISTIANSTFPYWDGSCWMEAWHLLPMLPTNNSISLLFSLFAPHCFTCTHTFLYYIWLL